MSVGGGAGDVLKVDAPLVEQLGGELETSAAVCPMPRHRSSFPASTRYRRRSPSGYRASKGQSRRACHSSGLRRPRLRQHRCGGREVPGHRRASRRELREASVRPGGRARGRWVGSWRGRRCDEPDGSDDGHAHADGAAGDGRCRVRPAERDAGRAADRSDGRRSRQGRRCGRGSVSRAGARRRRTAKEKTGRGRTCSRVRHLESRMANVRPIRRRVRRPRKRIRLRRNTSPSGPRHAAPDPSVNL